ncbi:hypothetical protein Bbelb_177470 [Branchiostoma belcheri]|nr:hypothetical protein Bbelb_177470 [Branchiostoma belcheri]
MLVIEERAVVWQLCHVPPNIPARCQDPPRREVNISAPVARLLTSGRRGNGPRPHRDTSIISNITFSDISENAIPICLLQAGLLCREDAETGIRGSRERSAILGCSSRSAHSSRDFSTCCSRVIRVIKIEKVPGFCSLRGPWRMSAGMTRPARAESTHMTPIALPALPQRRSSLTDEPQVPTRLARAAWRGLALPGREGQTWRTRLVSEQTRKNTSQKKPGTSFIVTPNSCSSASRPQGSADGEHVTPRQLAPGIPFLPVTLHHFWGLLVTLTHTGNP